MSRQRSHQGQAAAHGVLILDKPTGPTSHDVVSQVRRHFGTRRVGHAGTLDPLATGVLVLLLGEATKLSAYLTRQAKAYEAEVEFGIATDTLDSQGKITRRRDLRVDWAEANRSELEAALAGERARTLQIPPQVSAIKIAGQAAHARVRRGETVDIAPREVDVHEALLTRVEGRRASISLRVSKGYYVRSLARDWGDALGQPAHLTALRRTASGPFTLDDAVDLPLFPAGSKTPGRGTAALPQLMSLVEAAASSLPTGELNALGAQRAGFGQALTEDSWTRPPLLPEPPILGESADESAPSSSVHDDRDESGPEAIACLYEGQLVALADARTLRILRGISAPLQPPT